MDPGRELESSVTFPSRDDVMKTMVFLFGRIISAHDLSIFLDLCNWEIETATQNLSQHFGRLVVPDVPNMSVIGPDISTHVVSTKETFEASWEIANYGLKKWPPRCSLRFLCGTQMTCYDEFQGKSLHAGSSMLFQISLKSPLFPGLFCSSWRFCTLSGHAFGDVLKVKVVVVDPFRKADISRQDRKGNGVVFRAYQHLEESFGGYRGSSRAAESIDIFGRTDRKGNGVVFRAYQHLEESFGGFRGSSLAAENHDVFGRTEESFGGFRGSSLAAENHDVFGRTEHNKMAPPRRNKASSSSRRQPARSAPRATSRASARPSTRTSARSSTRTSARSSTRTSARSSTRTAPRRTPARSARATPARKTPSRRRSEAIDASSSRSRSRARTSSASADRRRTLTSSRQRRASKPKQKRPMTAYTAFIQANFKNRSCDRADFISLTMELANRWRGMSDDEKAHYQALADAENRRRKNEAARGGTAATKDAAATDPAATKVAAASSEQQQQQGNGQ